MSAACSTATAGMLITVVLLSSSVVAADGNADQVAQTAYLGCLNNAQAFETVDCEFVLRTGWARDFESAIAGNINDVVSTKARWVKRKHIERYRIETDAVTRGRLANGPTPHPTQKGLGIVQMIFGGVDRLDNGQFELKFNPDFTQATLLPADFSDEREGKDHPLQVVVFQAPALDWAMKMLKAGQLSLLGASVVDKGQQTKMLIQLGGTQTYGFEVEPSRGFLPTRLDCKKDNETIETISVSDTIRCSNGRYFPTKVSVIDWPTPRNPRFHVKTYAVTRLEIDKVPTDEDLSVQMPAGTLVSQVTDKTKRFRTKQDESVTSNDLVAIWGMLDRSTTTAQMDTGIPHRSNQRYYMIAGGAVILAMGYIAYRRKRINAGAQRIHTP